MSKKNRSLTLPELPEDIQRKIVLLLPRKAFARSSIVSKSWLSFYNSTRCSFYFSCQYCPNRVHEELTQEIMNFDKFLSASLLREKLTVDEFNINIQHYRPDMADQIYDWLDALVTTDNIVKVLRIKKPKSNAMDNLYLPPEILSNESLQVLHLEDCLLDRRLFSFGYPRNLSGLRVLSLLYVSIDGKSMNRLLTACPILEQLTFSNSLEGQYITIKSVHKLKDLNIHGFINVRIQEAPALENFILRENNYADRSIINYQVCRRIKNLDMIVNSKRTARHIQQIFSCLPTLENLNLTMLAPIEGIRISSRCLKNLRLFICYDHYLTMVEINAPNLRCYEFKSQWSMFSRHVMMKTGMLEMVVINLFIEKENPYDILELRKVLLMIEQLKLGVDTIKFISRGEVCVKASRLDKKLNVSATTVIGNLDAGALKLDLDGKFCFYAEYK